MSVAMGILSDYWPRWFGGKANTFANYNRDVYWVPWHFFMGDDYIDEVKNDLIDNLFNTKAQDQLRFELRKIKKFDNQINDFDFTAEDPLMWKKVAYQSRSLNFYWHPSAIFKPQYWALGDFSMQALPKGTVIPLDGGGYRICVSEVYLHLHDTFNFAGSAPLAVWDTKNKKFPSLSWSMMKLANSDFTGFRDKHGYGKDFTVLSPLYKVPGFEGKCFDVK